MNLETVERLLTRYGFSFEDGDLDCVGKYGEPGYENPKQFILLANWNKVPDYIQEGLTRRGYALEWRDEWIIDYDHDKAYRCVADSYDWTPSYFMGYNGDIYDKNDWSVDDRIEYFKNNYDDLEPFDLDLEPYGWYQFDCDDPEPFQSDNNRKKFTLHMNDHGLDVIFQNYSGGYTRIWLKAEHDEDEQVSKPEL